MDICKRIVHEYKVERVPASLISNITTLLIFASFVLVPLMVIIFSGNKIIGVIIGIILFIALLMFNQVVYSYVSFFVGMPFMLVSLLTSVDMTDYSFKDFANRMVTIMYEKGEIDIVTYQNSLNDISKNAWIVEEE